jgi:hypothetical protein
MSEHELKSIKVWTGVTVLYVLGLVAVILTGMPG